MPTRKRYYGFILDGIDKGKVIESDRSIHVTLSGNFIAGVFTESPVAASLASEERRYWREFRVGDRMYGVWLRVDSNDPTFVDKAVLALIDMHPSQARLCETRRRD